MISLIGIGTFLKGSKTAQMVAVCVMALIGVWGYGQLKYWQGGRGKAAEIIHKSNKAAVKKNKKARKIRGRNKLSNSRKRMLEYTNSN